MYRTRTFAFVFVLLIAAAGGIAFAGGTGDGGTVEGAAAKESGFTFASEHVRLTAYFSEEQVRLVLSDGSEFILPQTVSASGAKYSDGNVTFWTKGSEASLALDGVDYTVHIVDESTDPWVRAEHAGVDFRAVGQEPGWVLEIRDGVSVHLTLDYGETIVTTPVRSLEIDYAAGTRTYRAAPPTSPLSLTVQVADRVCYDAMSGEGFTHKVDVVFDDSGASYTGCGRPL